ncbi:MAG: DUF192 domain-containing protein [Candidatus Omnitrophica bacterium]|nr:DUF192 domain-containing protein [Candidatus Omnitrophota bacterium]MBD3269312.1 DUF192 domain-containing protein [Candidatus Omnitrophota bacterium]
MFKKVRYEIVNKDGKAYVAKNAYLAGGVYSRFLGLMFKKQMEKDSALVFYKAPSIHTFFMRFPIDIIFLDRQLRVIKITPYLKPWRIVNCFGSFATVELPGGRVREIGLKEGDLLEFVDK